MGFRVQHADAYVSSLGHSLGLPWTPLVTSDCLGPPQTLRSGRRRCVVYIDESYEGVRVPLTDWARTSAEHAKHPAPAPPSASIVTPTRSPAATSEASLRRLALVCTSGALVSATFASRRLPRWASSPSCPQMALRPWRPRRSRGSAASTRRPVLCVHNQVKPLPSPRSASHVGRGCAHRVGFCKSNDNPSSHERDREYPGFFHQITKKETHVNARTTEPLFLMRHPPRRLAPHHHPPLTPTRTRCWRSRRRPPAIPAA